MRRRDLFTVGTLALAGAAATASSASAGEPAAPKPVLPLDIAGIGLPIISEGRIRNYVFVTVRLTLGEGHTPDSLKSKVPYFRDALVRAAYRTPFVVANDWTRINDAAVNAMLMAAAPTLAGPGAVTRVEVALQSPRRRTSIRST
ncbi:MAG: hypothetical protein K2X25_02985 [Caulobacteraceae bacterium]|nr:hypothetical protein [Caulobacteraceae bacterium]